MAARKIWNFFATAQESFYRQKSRIQWLKDGDANTAFFYMAVIVHQVKNSIKYLRDAQNIRIDNEDQIKDMIISFCRQLLGSDSRGITPYSVDKIHSLHPFHCSKFLAESLVQIPSNEDIISTIFSMPKNKAPGLDGFPVEFFIEAWSIVGEDTVKAVREFFTAGFLLKRFNVTTIALLPKTSEADLLTSFRPVSCCSTIYKVIARLLKNKLKLFTPEVVQLNQVGFIKGHLLCEKVLLAFELVEGFHKEG